MSELLYTPVQVEGLKESERVFRIESGANAGLFIKVTQTRNDQDLDDDGVPDQINIKTSSCVCDENGQPVSIAGQPVVTPARVDSILTSALADGLVDLMTERANFTDASIFRALRQRTAYLSWANIPTE